MLKSYFCQIHILENINHFKVDVIFAVINNTSSMKSIQIFEQILIRSDEDILRTLPTEQRLACTICDTVRVSKRDSGVYAELCQDLICGDSASEKKFAFSL